MIDLELLYYISEKVNIPIMVGGGIKNNSDIKKLNFLSGVIWYSLSHKS